jgi:hypothetical protein
MNQQINERTTDCYQKLWLNNCIITLNSEELPCTNSFSLLFATIFFLTIDVFAIYVVIDSSLLECVRGKGYTQNFKQKF